MKMGSIKVLNFKLVNQSRFYCNVILKGDEGVSYKNILGKNILWVQ